MQNYERRVVYGHGTPFLLFKTPFGINISQNGRWMWRAKNIAEARRIVLFFGLNLI